MKKLICSEDVEKYVLEGVKEIYLEKNTILTPAAQDTIKINNIKVLEKTEIDNNQCNMDKMLELFKNLLDNNLLEEMIRKLLNMKNLKFEKIQDPSGLIMIKGNSIKMEKLNTKNEKNNISFQNILDDEEFGKVSGVLKMEKSNFSWNIGYNEVFYIVSGSVNISIKGNEYVGNKGDILYLPKDTYINFNSENICEVFYSSEGENWVNKPLEIKED